MKSIIGDRLKTTHRETSAGFGSLAAGTFSFHFILISSIIVAYDMEFTPMKV